MGTRLPMERVRARSASSVRPLSSFQAMNGTPPTESMTTSRAIAGFLRNPWISPYSSIVSRMASSESSSVSRIRSRTKARSPEVRRAR